MKVCMAIGYPIKHSLSPIMHNAGYKKLKIESEFVYVSCEAKPSDLKMAVDGIRALQIRGVSVTIPHKQTIMRYLDKIDAIAEKIGAVNTILNDNGVLTGFNSDWIGFLTALEKRINVEGKKIAVIGAGGAARAIVYGLTKKNAKVKIFNRTEDKAKKLANEFNCEYSDLSSLNDASKMDIIINATSVGMKENKSLIPKEFLKSGQIVFDIVYSPMETRLIKDAKDVGAKTILGYEMLLYQGVEQFRLYTGYDAPVEAMGEALIKNLV